MCSTLTLNNIRMKIMLLYYVKFTNQTFANKAIFIFENPYLFFKDEQINQQNLRIENSDQIC